MWIKAVSGKLLQQVLPKEKILNLRLFLLSSSFIVLFSFSSKNLGVNFTQYCRGSRGEKQKQRLKAKHQQKCVLKHFGIITSQIYKRQLGRFTNYKQNLQTCKAWRLISFLGEFQSHESKLILRFLFLFIYLFCPGQQAITQSLTNQEKEKDHLWKI